LLEALAGRSLAGQAKLSAKKKPTKSAFAPTEFDPEDPHKVGFGGLSEHHERRISVRIIQGSEAKGYLDLALTIELLVKIRPIRARSLGGKQRVSLPAG
jgi:hypothetical protein